MARFKTTHKNGTPKTCKFCGEHVWWDVIECRWYNPDGEVYHSDTCQLRHDHFRAKGLDGAEVKRQSRNPSEVQS